MKTVNQENIGAGIRFERIRRITGYLVGTVDKWNNAKRAELSDRVKHNSGEEETREEVLELDKG